MSIPSIANDPRPTRGVIPAVVDLNEPALQPVDDQAGSAVVDHSGDHSAEDGTRLAFAPTDTGRGDLAWQANFRQHQVAAGSDGQLASAAGRKSRRNLLRPLQDIYHTKEAIQASRDYSNALDQAQEKLENAPDGTYVRIRQFSETLGDRNFSLNSYEGTTVLTSGDLDSLLQPPLLEPNQRHHDTIVFKDSRMSPAVFDPNVRVIDFESLQ